MFELDYPLFRLINRVWTNRWLDLAMPVITDIHKAWWFRYGVAPAAVAVWLYKGGRRALRVLIVAGLACAACDLLAYRVLKPYVLRPRPEYSGVGARVLVDPSGRYGFPSNHAANVGAAAAVLSVAYPASRAWFWLAALIVAYSRVYVGAHFPLDVAAGLLLGGGLSWWWAVLMLGGAEKKRR